MQNHEQERGRGDILIVDDNLSNLKTLETLLSNEGYKVRGAPNGQTALMIMNNQPPELILLDVRMPGIDGFEVCRRLKQTPAIRDIPVIFLSASGEYEEKVKGFQNGGVDYITRPFNSDEVLARIKTHLTLHHLQLELTLAYKEVEKQVEERTLELVESNTQLKKEITERKQAEQALENHREQLEELVKERTKDLEKSNQDLQRTLNSLEQTQQQLLESKKMASLGELVAGIAHEVNTPLGIGVTGSSKVVDLTKEIRKRFQEKALSRQEFEQFLARCQNMGEIILKNLEHAATLIQSFKQIAVDQSSELKVSFQLKKYLKLVLSNLTPKFKNNNFKISIHGDEEFELVGYPGVITQILTNLINNSLLHGFDGLSDGAVEIHVEIQEEQVIWKYSDDGKGIPQAVQAKIFDPFFTTKRGQGGTGLGLHIIYNLVTQKLKGTIRCESQVGVGTTFIITLPRDPA